MGMSLIRAATKDHVYVQGLCRTGPDLHRMQDSGDLNPSLTSSSREEHRALYPSQALVMEVWVSQP